MFCPKCGYENYDKSNFCQKCGYNLKLLDKSFRKIEESDIKSYQTKNKNIIIITSIIVCAIIVFGTCYAYSFKNNEEAKLSSTVPERVIVTPKVQNNNNATQINNEIESAKKTSPFNFNCKDNEKVCPTISTQLLSGEDILTLTKDQVQLVINELYASHGYKFENKKWTTYFLKKTWYRGSETDQDILAKSFNQIEKSNLDLLRKERKY